MWIRQKSAELASQPRDSPNSITYLEFLPERTKFLRSFRNVVTLYVLSESVAIISSIANLVLFSSIGAELALDVLAEISSACLVFSNGYLYLILEKDLLTKNLKRIPTIVYVGAELLLLIFSTYEILNPPSNYILYGIEILVLEGVIFASQLILVIFLFLSKAKRPYFSKTLVRFAIYFILMWTIAGISFFLPFLAIFQTSVTNSTYIEYELISSGIVWAMTAFIPFIIQVNATAWILKQQARPLLRFCLKCGKELPIPGVPFCPFCGASQRD